MRRFFAAAIVSVLAATQVMAQTADPRREALNALAKRVTVDLDDARLQDVVQFLSTIGSIEFDPVWTDDTGREGLNPDALVSIHARNLPILSILERILAKTSEGFSGNTWQFTDDGLVQIGPKSRLNESAYLKVYDIQDLLFEVNNYTDVPELDLDAAVQQSQGGGGGGGGGQSIFQDDEGENGAAPTQEQQVASLIEIIEQSIDPDEWTDNGGDGASIRFYKGTFLVRAPGYIHRQLGGYDFWPQALPKRISDRGRDWKDSSKNTVIVSDPKPATPATAQNQPPKATPTGEGH